MKHALGSAPQLPQPSRSCCRVYTADHALRLAGMFSIHARVATTHLQLHILAFRMNNIKMRHDIAAAPTLPASSYNRIPSTIIEQHKSNVVLQVLRPCKRRCREPTPTHVDMPLESCSMIPLTHTKSHIWWRRAGLKVWSETQGKVWSVTLLLRSGSLCMSLPATAWFQFVAL